MKKFAILICLSLLASLPAAATTYKIIPGGGGDFTTISGCAAVAVAGDTCQIFAGTYTENISPANVGTSTLPIAYRTNQGDLVTINGNWSLPSNVSGSWIIITGAAKQPLMENGVINWAGGYMQHSVFQYITATSSSGNACFGGNGWYSSNTATSFNQFLNITVSNCGGSPATAGFEMEGNDNLFDGIICSHQQSCYQIAGQFNVIRNSRYGPTVAGDLGGAHSQPIESSLDCTGGPGHADIAGGTQHLLVENNYSNGWRGPNSHALILNTDAASPPCGSTANVIRLTSAMESGSYLMQGQSSPAQYYYNIASSNTQLDNTGGPGGGKDREDLQCDPNSPNCVVKNSIFYNNWSTTAPPDYCLFLDTGYTENNNLCDNVGTSTWVGPLANSGSNTYDASDIFNSDPLFQNSTSNLQLQIGSPASGAGSSLTAAVGAGTGSTSLVVADSNYFFAINGSTPNSVIPGVQNDWIRIGTSILVQLCGISYSTNTLTLCTAESWVNNEPIYLARDSNGNLLITGTSNPDMGAFPLGTSPITFIGQSGIACVGASTVCTTTATLNVQAGDAIAIPITPSRNSCDPLDAVTDTAGNTYTQVSGSCFVNGSIGAIEMFTGIASSASASDLFTITLHTPNPPGTNIIWIAPMQYRPISPVQSLDAVSGTNIGNFGVVTTGGFSTIRSQEVIIQCTQGEFSATNWSAGLIGTATGTMRLNITPSSGQFAGHFALGCQDLIVSAKQSNITATMSAQNAISQNMSTLISLVAPFPVVIPGTPIVNPGGSVSFSCAGDCGTPSANPWSCVTIGGCLGSIVSSTGAYTPPATQVAHNALGGYQVQDNASVFNVNVSALQPRSDSAVILANGVNKLNFLPEFPFNYNTTALPNTPMIFFVTPIADSGYTCVPTWPSMSLQNGFFDAQVNNGSVDHHYLGICTDNGTITEFYQFYSPGTNPSCPTCNSQAGRRYGNNDWDVPYLLNGVNAANLDITPLVLKRDELINACENGGSINHALQFTIDNTFIRGTVNQPYYIWPAFNAFGGFGGPTTHYYGERMRLKSSFNIGTFSPCAQKILTALQNYGMFLVDGGFQWQIGIEYGDYDATISNAFIELSAASIPVSSTNFDILDESNLEVTPNSSQTNLAETIQYTTTTGTTQVPIVINGTAVDLPTSQVYAMAGASAFQLTGYSAAGGITWSMSPSVGTLTSGGLYTPPGTEATLTTTTITATSSINPAVTAQLTMWIFPNNAIRALQDTSNYTDSHGNTWFGAYGLGSVLGPLWEGCCQTQPSPPFPSMTDQKLFINHYGSSQTLNDWKMDIHVPNNTYAVTYNLGTVVPAGADALYFYLQGQFLAQIDPAGVVGVNEPYTLTQTVTVTNGILSLYNAGIGNQANNVGDVSSFSAVSQPPPLVPGVVVTPGVTMGAGTVVVQ